MQATTEAWFFCCQQGFRQFFQYLSCHATEIDAKWRQTYMPDARKRPFLFESTRSYASECLNSITQLSVSVCSWLVAGSTWHEIVIGAQSFPKCGRQGKDWRKDQVFVVNVLDGKRIPCINDLPTYNALNKAKLLKHQSTSLSIWFVQTSVFSRIDSLIKNSGFAKISHLTFSAKRKLKEVAWPSLHTSWYFSD